MFADYGQPKYFNVAVAKRQEVVEVRYSMVTREALGDQKALPGSLPHGADAMRNAGVSIMREDRELLLDKAFVNAGARREAPQDRWWGCEVRFGSGCDDLFGVDHNKQMVAAFSDVAQELASSDRADDELREERGDDADQLYEIVEHIRGTVRSMRGEIDQLFAARRQERKRAEPVSAERDAEQRASQVVAEQVQAEGPQTDTDRAHTEMSDEAREAELAEYFELKGIEDPAGKASELIANDSWFRFLSEELDAHQMFSVRPRGGVLVVALNTEHSLYQFLQFLEDRDETWRHRAAVAIRALILAWARMESGIERNEEKYEVQAVAGRWGRYARDVLQEINSEVGPAAE